MGSSNPSRPVVIVGAGPAGMSAAIALAECGVPCTVIDENAELGGQIYRQPPAGLRTSRSAAARREDRGAALRKRIHALRDKISWCGNSQVWGVFEPRKLAVTTPHGWQLMDAQRLVLAPGAYEFVPPFPGWTLPGVMTPGAAQVLCKSMSVVPGRRVLVAGTGPFLLVVAVSLHRAGANVIGVVEAVRRREAARALPRMLSSIELLRQGCQYLWQLRRANIPVYTGQLVTAAEGNERVQHVRMAPCDREWRPDATGARRLEVDTLCVGYGFVPRSELAQLAGCELYWRNEWGGWIPKVDENQATSVPGIWAAGDGCGVAGAAAAGDEGTLAGLAAARDCGVLDAAAFRRRRRRVVRRLERLRRFRRALDKLSGPRPGLSELALPDTVVCRCEELLRGEVDAAIASGCTSSRTLKVATRLGMGPCQGRMCWPAMARFVASSTGTRVEEVGPHRVRPPIVPVTLGDLAEGVHPDETTQEGSLC